MIGQEENHSVVIFSAFHQCREKPSDLVVDMCDAGIVSRHCIVLLFGIVAAVDRVFPISELFGTCGVIPVAAGRCPKFFVFVQIEVGCRRIKRLVRTDIGAHQEKWSGAITCF